MVWGVSNTVIESTFLFLALRKEKENKDDEVKVALGKLCPELQWMQWADEWPPQQIHFPMVLIWPTDEKMVSAEFCFDFSGTHSSPKTQDSKLIKHKHTQAKTNQQLPQNPAKPNHSAPHCSANNSNKKRYAQTVIFHIQCAVVIWFTVLALRAIAQALSLHSWFT